MKMSFKTVWTENAVQDLIIIKDFISQDSPDEAEKWILKLYNAAEEVVDFPHRGRIVPEFNQENLRELLISNYRLVYRIKKSTIEIITVFEGHRQLSKNDIKK